MNSKSPSFNPSSPSFSPSSSDPSLSKNQNDQKGEKSEIQPYSSGLKTSIKVGQFKIVKSESNITLIPNSMKYTMQKKSKISLFSNGELIIGRTIKSKRIKGTTLMIGKNVHTFLDDEQIELVHDKDLNKIISAKILRLAQSKSSKRETFLNSEKSNKSEDNNKKIRALLKESNYYFDDNYLNYPQILDIYIKGNGLTSLMINMITDIIPIYIDNSSLD